MDLRRLATEQAVPDLQGLLARPGDLGAGEHQGYGQAPHPAHHRGGVADAQAPGDHRVAHQVRAREGVAQAGVDPGQ